MKVSQTVGEEEPTLVLDGITDKVRGKFRQDMVSRGGAIPWNSGGSGEGVLLGAKEHLSSHLGGEPKFHLLCSSLIFHAKLFSLWTGTPGAEPVPSPNRLWEILQTEEAGQFPGWQKGRLRWIFFGWLVWSKVFRFAPAVLFNWCPFTAGRKTIRRSPYPREGSFCITS